MVCVKDFMEIEYFKDNKECIREDCPYYPVSK
jgi:hypothetical protein